MNKKGFTILEILVVLTVLAILIGIAVPRMKGMQDQAKIQKVKSELSTLRAGIETYYVNHSNVYPTTSSVLGSATLKNESIKIIQSELIDPFSATSSEYNYIRNGNYYAVWSIGVAGDGSISAMNSATGAVTTAGTAGSVICATNGGGC